MDPLAQRHRLRCSRLFQGLRCGRGHLPRSRRPAAWQPCQSGPGSRGARARPARHSVASVGRAAGPPCGGRLLAQERCLPAQNAGGEALTIAVQLLQRRGTRTVLQRRTRSIE